MSKMPPASLADTCDENLEHLRQEADDQPDHYVTHLSEVNKQEDVVCCEDVYSAHGALIAKKGERLNSRLAQRVLQHRLAKPLEEQVKLSSTLEGPGLLANFQRVLGVYPDLARLNESLGYDKEWAFFLNSSSFHPVLLQKLTVLDRRMPQQLAKALSLAWLSGLMAREAGLSRKQQDAIRMAGLYCDLGFLHLPLEVLNKQGDLLPSEWRSIQAHVVVGQAMVEREPSLSPEVAQAVLEHHERHDGTGYPTGRAGERLSLAGQILGLGDSLQALRSGVFARTNRNLADAIPFLQVSGASYPHQVSDVAINIIKHSRLQRSLTSLGADSREYARSLLAGINTMAELVVMITAMIDLCDDYDCQAKGRCETLVRACVNLRDCIYSSGLERLELLSWLEQVAREGDDTALPELNDIELMLSEVRWKLDRLIRCVKALLDAQSDKTSSRWELLDSFTEHLHKKLSRLSVKPV